MAAIINAVSGGAGGLQSKGDASGVLDIQTASTTAITIDASQNVTFTNALTSATITSATIKSAAVNTPTVFQDSAGTQVGTLCRAWVNFDGTAGTIKASFNVSSITKNSTGDYTANFTNAMTDVNYAACASTTGSTGAASFIVAGVSGTQLKTTGGVQMQTRNLSNTATDLNNLSLSIFR